MAGAVEVEEGFLEEILSAVRIPAQRPEVAQKLTGKSFPKPLETGGVTLLVRDHELPKPVLVPPSHGPSLPENPCIAPRCNVRRGRGTQRAVDQKPSLAVVVPTLNEERAILACLASIGPVPTVVSDGGSRDRTLDVVRIHAPHAVVVQGPPGRGPQLARGVAALSARAYLFLHADCRLPPGWLPAVQATLADPTVALGCFRLHTDPPGPGPHSTLMRLWYRLLDLRSFALALPYGDQAFFLRRETLEAAGGVPQLPLMEDLELARRCRKLGRIVRVPLPVRTTGRRFGQRPVRARLATLTFPWLYRFGVSPQRLARWYGEAR